MRPTAIDVCAGAGGLSLGLLRAGFDLRAAVDADRDAAETHRRHVGPCDWADVLTWSPPSADLCAGGVPCQPFSIAGKGLALDDPRYLVPALLRIASMCGARAVLLENVYGLVTRHPRAFRAVLEAFEARWHTTWTVLDAADYGVPQHRDRLFVLGFRDAADRARFRWPAPTHAPPGELFGAPYRTVREALGLGPTPRRAGRRKGAKGWQGERMLDVDAPSYAIGASSFDLLDEPAPCVTASEQKSAMGCKQPVSRRRRASERLSEALGALDQPAPVITAGGTESGGGAEPIANRQQRERLHREIQEAGLANRPSTTIAADPRVAPLSPAQCAALQGFPPDWTWTGTKTSQHRQIGNAVPPALAEAVARSILETLTFR